MNIHEQAKLELGRQWLTKMKYLTEWSNEQFIDAVNREGMSPEAKAAIVFTLKYYAAQAFAEGDALIAEGEALSGTSTIATITPKQSAA